MIITKTSGINCKYDVIIIGGGIGGLTAAAYLCSRGVKPLIIEQMNYVGGNICSFRHKGFYFDGGPTSVSFLTILKKVYGDLGLFDKLDFVKVHHQIIGPGFNIIINSKDDLLNGLVKAFPDSEKEIIAFYAHLKKIVNAINPIYDHHPSYNEGFKKIILGMLFPLLHYKTFSYAMKYTEKTKMEMVNHYFKKNKKLHDFIAATGYADIAAVDLAFMWETFAGDLYYTKNGMVSLVKPLAEYIESHGGDILLSNKVTKYLVNKSEHVVTGVLLESGETLTADYFIAAGDYKRTFLSQIDRENVPAALISKLEKAGVTETIVNLFIGLDIPLDDLKEIKTPNSIIYLEDGLPHYLLDKTDKDYFKKVNFSVYIPTYNDRTLNEPGKTSIIMAAAGYYEWNNYWNTDQGKRGESYKQLKKEITEQMIGRLEKIMPQIRKHIVYSSLATPFTYERYTLTWQGASCGWAGAKEKAFFKSFVETQMAHLTPYKNMFMAGQWTYFNGGIPSALNSGRFTGIEAANAIKKKRKKENRIKDKQGK